MQERHNSIANALELCLSCTNPSIIDMIQWNLSHEVTTHLNDLSMQVVFQDRDNKH